MRGVSVGLAFIALGALASPACGDRALKPDGGGRGGAGQGAGTSGHDGTGELAGTTGQAGAGGQAGTGGPAAGCGAAAAFDASPSAGKTVVASIRLSASTNTPPVDVVVYSDASAERTVGPFRFEGGIPIDPKSYPAGSPEVVAFLCDLAAAGDVSRLPVTSCPKSVSFGTTETVTAGDKTSSDVECLADTASAAAKALAHDCDVLTARRS